MSKDTNILALAKKMKSAKAQAEFSPRVYLPLISSSGVAQAVFGTKMIAHGDATTREKKVMPMALARRAASMGHFERASAVDEPPSMFFSYFARALYKTEPVQKCVANHAVIAAVGVTRGHLKFKGVDPKNFDDDVEKKRIASNSVGEVHSGHARVDAIYVDLVRILLSKAHVRFNTSYTVARDVLHGIQASPNFMALKESIGSDPGLAATAALLLLNDRAVQRATTESATSAGESQARNGDDKEDDVASMVDSQDGLPKDVQSGIDGAVSQTRDTINRRANDASVPSGAEASQERKEQEISNALANGLTSGDEGPRDALGRTDGGHEAGDTFSENQFSLTQLRAAMETFRTLVANKKVGRAKQSRRQRYGVKTTHDAVKDVFGAMGRVEGLMLDAISHSRHGDGEIVDVSCGNELHNLLPVELLKIAMPEYKALFVKQFMEETLLIHTRQGVSESGAGPLIAFIDLSSSMDSRVNLGGDVCVNLGAVAQAFALALARYTISWNRKAIIVPFNHGVLSGQKVTCGGYDAQRVKREVKTLCGLAPSGGTSFTLALQYAARLLERHEDDYEYADVVFFTDGQGDARCTCLHHADRKHWREDIATRQSVAEDRSFVLREAGLPPSVRTFALMFGGGYRDTGNDYDDDGVPKPGTYADGVEHENSHMFDCAVHCSTTEAGMRRGVKRFFSELVTQAFYRET